MEIVNLKFYRTTAEILDAKKYSGINVNMTLMKMIKANDNISLDFNYMVKYDPKVAVLSLDGRVLLKGKKTEVDSIYTTWTKKRALPKELSEKLANLIVTNCQITGVLVAKSLELPAPIFPPKIKV